MLDICGVSHAEAIHALDQKIRSEGYGLASYMARTLVMEWDLSKIEEELTQLHWDTKQLRCLQQEAGL